MSCSTRLPRLFSQRCVCSGPSPTSSPTGQTRFASTTRRSRTDLRNRPDASFSKTTETRDHIIFNPPSSAPNVYHTPSKFLPKSDPRRRLHTMSLQSATSSSAPTESSKSLPPPVRPVYEKKYHLTQADIDEIRRLRTEDPKTWTRVRLAEKFECSQFYVSLCVSAPQIKAERDKELEAIKKRWGRGKMEAREERQRRKEGWGKGE